MTRRYFSLAYLALITVVHAAARAVVDVVRLAIHAVATPVTFIWARLALPKVSGFKIIGNLKRVYRESWLTSGQSLHYRRWIYC